MQRDATQQSVFEVLTFTKTPVRGMDANHWYIESVHEALQDGVQRYDQLSRSWPDPRVMLVLVRSEFDEGTGLFRDTVIRARARSTMLSRRNAKPMPPEARKALAQLSGGGKAMAPLPERPTARPVPERRRGGSGEAVKLALAALAGAGFASAALIAALAR